MQRQRILLIEAERETANTVQSALTSSKAGSFSIEWVESCSEGLRILADERASSSASEDRIAAVLTNLVLGDARGIETFERLVRAAPRLPILILCAAEFEEAAKLAVRRGAQDYILKDRVDDHVVQKALRNMLDRTAIAERLFEERELARITLDSIRDAVVSTNCFDKVTYLNVAAEALTGWSREDAVGHSAEDVLRIVDAASREPLPNPMTLAIQANTPVFLGRDCVFVRHDGLEVEIEDSAVPIQNCRGQVTGAAMVLRDVSATRALSSKMAHLAHHDSFTNVFNRAALTDRLTLALALGQRHKTHLALLFLDLDHFNRISASLGRHVGERLLRSIAMRLQSTVRCSDTVSRLGGDEFVVLLSELAREDDAAICAERILLALSAPYFLDEHCVHVTASIGIVTTNSDDELDADTLMKHADAAMYRAKERGRNNYQFFDASVNVRAAWRQSLGNDLRYAIERRELVLHYQPIIDLAAGSIVGVEALLRWCHPVRGLLGPDQFVPIAEESGFIIAIGQWVMLEACRQAREWQDAGFAPMRVAINVSAAELRDESFLTNLRKVLVKTNLAPRYLELELTETFLMQDSATTALTLASIKDIGVSLALDDFGTGFSSLSHLRHFPVDTLKIDRAFVEELTTSAEDAGIVAIVIGMGHTLNLRSVAEGIETGEQFAFLRAQGCSEGQGFGLSPPVPAETLVQLLARSGESNAWPEWYPGREPAQISH